MMANEPRSFTVTFTEVGDTINAVSENHGFEAWELMNLLTEKMLDVYNQVVCHQNFEYERVYKDEDGNWIKVKEKNNDT